MDTFHATVDYETKKGNLKTAMIDVKARDMDHARRVAAKQIKSNGLRQCRRITTTTIVPQHDPVPERRAAPPARRRGFLARLFTRNVRDSAA